MDTVSLTQPNVLRRSKQEKQSKNKKDDKSVKIRIRQLFNAKKKTKNSTTTNTPQENEISENTPAGTSVDR